MDNFSSSGARASIQPPPNNDLTNKYRSKAASKAAQRGDQNEFSPKPNNKHNFQYTQVQNSKIGSPTGTSKHNSVYSSQRCKSTRQQRPQSPQYGSKQAYTGSNAKDKERVPAAMQKQNAQKEVNAYASNLSLRYAVSRQETLKKDNDLDSTKQFQQHQQLVTVKRTKFDPKLHQKSPAGKQSPLRSQNQGTSQPQLNNSNNKSNIISYSVIQREDSNQKQQQQNVFSSSKQSPFKKLNAAADQPRVQQRENLNKTTINESNKTPKRSLSKSATERFLTRTDCFEGLSNIVNERYSNLLNAADTSSQEVNPFAKHQSSSSMKKKEQQKVCQGNKHNKSYMLVSKTETDQQIILQQQSTPSSDSNKSHEALDNQDSKNFIGFGNMVNNNNNDGDTNEINPTGGVEDQGFMTQKTNKSNASAPRELNIDIILDFLVKEEQILCEFSLMANQGQLLELQQLLPLPASLSYLGMIQFVNCTKERPKFFSKQLQVTLLLVNSLMELFSPLYLQRYSHKFRTVYTNVHLNFLLYIDTMLSCCNLNPNDNQIYSYLRKLTVKKLNSKQKAQRLTCFRQNNEVNLIIIKKICRQVIQQSQNENFFGYVECIENFQEVLRSYENMEYEDIQDKIDSFDPVLALQQKQALAKKTTFRRAKSPYPSGPAISNNNGLRTNSRGASPRLYSPRSLTKLTKIEMHSVSSPKLHNQSQDHGFIRNATTTNLMRNNNASPSNTISNNKSMSRKNLSKNNSRTKIQDSVDYGNVIDTSNSNRNNHGVSQSLQFQEGRHNISSNNFMLPENADFLRTICKDADADSSTVIINDNNYFSNNFDNNYSVLDSDASSQFMNQTSNYISNSNNNNVNGSNNGANSRPKSKIPRITSATSVKKNTSNYNNNNQQQVTQQQQNGSWSQSKLGQLQKSSVTRLRKSSPRNNEPKFVDNVRKTHKESMQSSSCTLDDLAANQVELSREPSMLSSSVNNSSISTPVKPRLLASAKMQKRPQSRLAQSSSKQSLANNQIANTTQKVSQRGNPATGGKTTTKHNFQLGFVLQKDKLDASQLSTTHPVKVTNANVTGNSKIKKDNNQASPTQTLQSNKSRTRKGTTGDAQSKRQQVNTQNTQQINGPHHNGNIMSQTTGKAIISAKMIESQHNNSQGKKSPTVQRSHLEQQQLIQTNETKAQTNGTTQELSIQDFESESNMNSLAENNFYGTITPQKKILIDSHDQEFTSSSNHLNERDEEFSNGSPNKNMDSVLQFSDNRLDLLLKKMEQPEVGKQLTALDLKKEMDKMKQLDMEQKMQKRIKLNIDKQQPSNETVATTEHIRLPTSESPSKKRFLGEFDDTKKEFRISLGEEMLLNKRPSKMGSSNQYFDGIDEFEDPFLDHQGECSSAGASGSNSKEEVHSVRREMSQVVENSNEIQLNKEFSEVVEAQEEQEEELDDDEREKLAIDEEQKRLREMVSVPFLPPLNNGKEYTLVLDLDETLIHFDCDEDNEENEEGGGYYLIRPHCLKFLQELSKYYDLVIFTAAMPDYADWILDNVDKNGIIKHRLYRQHTTPHEDYAIKDLHNLGRPIEKTIIIDNLAENFIHTTPDNGIWVESWYDDMDDTVLEMLIPFLKNIVTQRVADVRQILTKDIKEKTIYRCLEEGTTIPSITDLVGGAEIMCSSGNETTTTLKSPFAKDWNIDDLLI